MSATMKKADIVAAIAATEATDFTFDQLKKLTVKKLIALAEEHNIQLGQESVKESEGEGVIPSATTDEMDVLVAKMEKILERGATPTQEFYSESFNAIREASGLDPIWTPQHVAEIAAFYRTIQSWTKRTVQPETIVRRAERVLEKDDQARRDSGGDHGYQTRPKSEAPAYVQERVSRILAEAEEAEKAEETEQAEELADA